MVGKKKTPQTTTCTAGSTDDPNPDLRHATPNFVVLGFSGRKEIGHKKHTPRVLFERRARTWRFPALSFCRHSSSRSHDPTVLGQVADLSLRTVACPCIIVKVPVAKTKRLFLARAREAYSIISLNHSLDSFLQSFRRESRWGFRRVFFGTVDASEVDSIELARSATFEKSSKSESENARPRRTRDSTDARPPRTSVGILRMVETRPRSHPGGPNAFVRSVRVENTVKSPDRPARGRDSTRDS